MTAMSLLERFNVVKHKHNWMPMSRRTGFSYEHRVNVVMTTKKCVRCSEITTS